MAITITATVGSASANSYLTLSDANAIIEGLVLDDDVTAWDNSTTDNKNRALFTATQRIDRERFLGARVADTQALQWPRSGVRKPDTYTNLYGLSFPNRLVADYYSDTEIIKNYGCNKVINEIGEEFNFEILKSTDFIFFNKKKIKNSLVKVFYKN